MKKLLLGATIILSFSTIVSDATATTIEEVVAGANHLYRQRIEAGRARFDIDVNAAFLARVQRIADGLITEARQEYPWAAQLDWEIHTTNAGDESASCMAGGKILIGMPYVERMELTDAELAMLLSHEIQHAVQQHNFKEILEAQKLSPALQNADIVKLEDAVDSDQNLMQRLSEFDRGQEFEADHEGLLLARKAGWPPQELAGYFRKLGRADRQPNQSDIDHPSPALRWRRIRELVDELQRTPDQTVVIN